jgi:hypothetical protein
MRADEIAYAFNGATYRGYWKAAIAGTRTSPEVHFNSRSSMVRIAYRLATDDFVVTFSKTDAAFGDFLASTYRALVQIEASLKAAGLGFRSVLGPGDDAALRIEYSPIDKLARVRLANRGDDWPEAEPLPFKVPERKSDEGNTFSVDALNIDL